MQKLEPISRSCKHLLSVIEHGTHEGYAYDITPYMPEGSLEGQILDDKIVMQVVVPQLASALHILHQNELLHNDIKPSNIYWDSRNTTIVLGDFDTVTFADQNTCEDISGTREYMAPEKLTGGQAAASQAADYCSMGLTLLALLQGESPLRSASARAATCASSTLGRAVSSAMVRGKLPVSSSVSAWIIYSAILPHPGSASTLRAAPRYIRRWHNS